MNLTGEMEVMEVITWPSGEVVSSAFRYEGIETLGQARELLREEHNGFLQLCVNNGTIVCFSVLARLIREGG